MKKTGYNWIKRISCAALLLLLLCASVPASAMVQGEIDEVIPEPGLEAALERAWEVIRADEGKTLEEISDENGANYYHYNPYGHTVPEEPVLTVQKEDTWDDVIAKLFDKYGVEPGQDNLALTYYNTVTGEHHAYNDDAYFVTASLFKVPLCMLVAEKVSAGEITMDEPIAGSPFSYQEFRALAHSDNAAALYLEDFLGGFFAFRDQEVKFTEENPKDDLGDAQYFESYNTAHQMENVLRHLQAEPERFPGVIENMLIDTPYEYYKMWDRRYPTAQKWGYVPHTDEKGAHDYVNNMGIIYTEHPILLVTMTDNLAHGYDIIGEYATLMIDYTAFRVEEYKQQCQTARTEAVTELKTRSIGDYAMELQCVPRAPGAVNAQENTAGEEKESKMTVLSTAMLVVVISAVVFALVVLSRRNKGGRIGTVWAVLALVVAGIAMVLCIFGMNTGTLTAEVEGNPQDSVRGFFDNLIAGNYDKAYTYLANYSSLGLEAEPETEEGKLIYSALKRSWDYTLKGDAAVDKLSATQTVSFRYLSLDQVEKAAAEEIEGILDTIVQSRPYDEVYDENNRYRASVTDEAYLTALKKALESETQYYRTAELTLNLEYTDGMWKILADNSLLSCLMGGIS